MGEHMRDIDSIITDITTAPTEAEALAALDGVRPTVVLAVADQLYVDAAGRALPWVRKAIVAEARA